MMLLMTGVSSRNWQVMLTEAGWPTAVPAANTGVGTDPGIVQLIVAASACISRLYSACAAGSGFAAFQAVGWAAA